MPRWAPPAEREYAVDPVGVDTTRPSARTVVRCAALTETLSPSSAQARPCDHRVVQHPVPRHAPAVAKDALPKAISGPRSRASFHGTIEVLVHLVQRELRHESEAAEINAKTGGPRARVSHHPRAERSVPSPPGR